MSKKNTQQMVHEIHTALFGPDSNPEEGVFSITKRNEREIAGMKTTLQTIKAVVLAMPLVVGALAYFGVEVNLSSTEVHQ